MDDRRAIAQLIHRYGADMDRKAWKSWGEIFCDDIVAEYFIWNGAELGSCVGAERLVRWMQASMAPWPVTHHLMGNIEIEIEGDIARSTSYVQATHVKPPGEGDLFQAGGWYENVYLRLEKGWLISRLRLELIWTRGGAPNVAELPDSDGGS